MRDFADLLEAYFDQACEATGREVHSLTLADRQIEFHFAGPRWTSLLRALGNTVPANGNARLRVHVWDGSQPCRNHVLRAYLYVISNWWFDYVGPRGQLLDLHQPDLQALYIPGPDLLMVVDIPGARAFCWKREPTDLPYWEVCSPFRPLLHCWLRSEGLQFVHAAAVGTEHGGALLVGQGGSGKSSTALACLESGLRYLGDDYCMLESRNGEYFAHALYTTAKLVGDQDLIRFPKLAAHVFNPNREPDQKLAFFLQDHFGQHFIRSFPVRAVVLPKVAHRDTTTIEPCKAAEALAAIAPSSMSQLPASGAQDLKFLGEISRRLPAYRMHLGYDTHRLPALLAGLIERHTLHATESR